MAKPEVTSKANIRPIEMQKYNHYLPAAYDDTLTMLEKVNKVIYQLNELGKVTNDMIDKWNEVVEWVVGEGLEDTVIAVMEKWEKEGKFADLVQQVLEDLQELGVNIKIFGADGTGKNDSIGAIEEAIKTGFPVYIPVGTFAVSRQINLPSNTDFGGAGIDKSVLTFTDGASNGQNLVTNEDTNKGNKHIRIHDMTLDGNLDGRFGSEKIDGQGGSRDSNLTMRASENFDIYRVKSIHSVLHGIDVTCGGLDYPYLGDGTEAPNPSRYGTIRNCETYDFGDDGITTHHSEYITIKNNYCHDARDRGNQNGIEIDDGSRHISLSNNETRHCFGSLEIKAHANAPAPYNINVNGHTSTEDVRAYNFRHIGHHSSGKPQSQTAQNIVCSNLVCINPNNTRGFQGGGAPRALVISAYYGVSINGMSCYTDKPELASGMPLIALQFRSRNINLNGITITGFTQAKHAIRMFGGGRKTDDVNISNVVLTDSSTEGIVTGGGIEHVNITNVNGIKSNPGADDRVVTTVNNQPTMQNITARGYPHTLEISGQYYDHGVDIISKGARIASSTAGPIAKAGMVATSTGSSSASNSKTTVLSSSGSHATGEYGFVASSLSSEAREGHDVVLGSSNSISESNRGSILSSYNVKQTGSYKVNGGFGKGSTAQTSNIQWQLDGLNGQVRATGKFTGSHTWTDIAEYLESVSGEAIPTGTLVTMEGEKVRPAAEGETIVGAISETAGLVMGESTFTWQNRYMKNEFGGLIYENVEMDNGDIEKVAKENPDFDENKAYVSRADRDEWQIVGLLGQIYVRTNEDLQTGNGIMAKDGQASQGETGYVMKTTTPYNSEKGYGVALVLFK